MTLKFKHFIFALLSTLFFSCGNDELEETSRFEKLPSFHTLHLNSVFNVYLIQDTTFSVRIAGFGDTPEKISLMVVGDTLTIADPSKGKWFSPEKNKVKLYISADKLAVVYANATCYFESINPIISNQFALIMESDVKLMEANLELNCNNFTYWNNYLCGGKLTLSGRVGGLSATTFATMAIDASNLIADRAYLDNNSKGDCTLFVNDRLEYSIRGIGNIYLGGNPAEIILGEKTSSGRLIPL